MKKRANRITRRQFVKGAAAAVAAPAIVPSSIFGQQGRTGLRKPEPQLTKTP